MSAKILILTIAVAVLAVSASATTCTSTSPHDVNFGARQYGDQLLFQDQQKMSSKFLRVVTNDVTYPVQGIITYIEVTDASNSMTKGGCASLLSGGVGTNQVSLHLKSQRGLPYNFFIRIWGRK